MDASPVYWPVLCGNDTGREAWLIPNLTLYTHHPTLTQCFVDTVLVWVPYGYLFVFAPFYIIYLTHYSRRHSWNYCSWLNATKLGFILLLWLTALLELVWILELPHPHPAQIQAAVIKLLGLSVIGGLTRAEFILGLFTSGFQFFFWMILLITEILHLASTLELRFHEEVSHLSAERRAQIYAEFSLTVTSFVLQLMSDSANVLIAPAASTRSTRSREQSYESLDEKRALLGDHSGEELPTDLEKTPKPSPQLWVPSWMQFTYIWSIIDILRNVRTVMTFDKLFDLRPIDTVKYNITIYINYYKQQYNFYKAFFCTVYRPLLFAIVIRTPSMALQFINPQILRAFISYIEARDPYTWKGVVLAGVLFLSQVLISMSIHNFLYYAYLGGARVRTVLNSVIYRKTLKLSSSARKSTTVGEIVNLMAVDAQKIQDSTTYCNLLWEVAIEVPICMYFLWQTIGVASFAGLAVLLVTLPSNGVYVANLIRKLQAKQMRVKDSRIKIMSEVLSGIKIIKLYAWEPSFMRQIEAFRKEELALLLRTNLLNALSTTIWFLSPVLIAVATFTTYILISPDNILTPDKAFVTLSLVNILNITLTLLPQGVSYTGQALVSFSRINRFLSLDELPDVDEQPPRMFMSDPVEIVSGSFAWQKDALPTLVNIDLRIPEGKLVAVVGQVGAGKSSLMSTLLGETIRRQGSMRINGSVAYVPQQAWIQNKTVKENILFSQRYNQIRYSEIIEACAMTADLKILPAGDGTEIGEKGINLSGGQKQRISLARAVYQDSDIYLLDDPLSAVDVHVGKHIFDHVIGPSGLLQHKTRVLVTHSVKFLPQVDTILVMKGGRISEAGDYHSLLEANGDFAEFLRNYFLEESVEESDEEALEIKRQVSLVSGTESEPEDPVTRRKRKRSRQSTVSAGETRVLEREISEIVASDKSKLIDDETEAVGKVSYKDIMSYVRAGGCRLFLILVVFEVLSTAAQVGTNIWLSSWSDDALKNTTTTVEQSHRRLAVYAALAGLTGLCICVVTLSIAIGSVNASKVLHERLVHRLFRAPMSFFDTTPMGRILNRISKDMDTVDSTISLNARMLMFSLIPILATVVVISYTTPIFLVAILLLTPIYYITQKIYIVYARQLKRIDSVRKSPVYSHLAETISGLSSIRSYRRIDEFVRRCDRLIDDSQKPFFMLIAAMRALAIFIETLGAVLIFCSALFAVLARDTITPGLAGLSVTFALQVAVYLNVIIRSITQVENDVVSVERILEYTTIDQEAPWEVPGNTPSNIWPTDGEVKFKDYNARYRPGLDLVLKDINLTIKPAEKVGIVGRTGAGKSSLSLALFRIIEAAQGSIAIDDVTLSFLGLRDVRSSVSIIPQDPVVFSGSLRMNLDPFEQYTDEEVWFALEHAHLKSFVAMLPEGLQYECGEEGQALSIGQRQLVCLARALLRRSKVLILDEATAAVDLETDALIQTTIREEFQRLTVLTVAHRLNTVIDYDKIIVLDKGRVIEFDTPAALLENKKSMFYSMAKEAGVV